MASPREEDEEWHACLSVWCGYPSGPESGCGGHQVGDKQMSPCLRLWGFSFLLRTTQWSTASPSWEAQVATRFIGAMQEPSIKPWKYAGNAGCLTSKNKIRHQMMTTDPRSRKLNSLNSLLCPAAETAFCSLVWEERGKETTADC